ncbi:L-cystine transporter [Lysinibacillus endophyticus]|uniref:L-cystine transporter n=1 Tax=Ureibacillus endophyticus TaxID=1978490 RepID=UPI0020A17250|nr:cation:dicarboxylase symporter family transporter [Lysinibacillus endophyticus]MCP1145286.1 cation:dicarboxylase symporter family transporter [Lysinibacillus endophyticus]
MFTIINVIVLLLIILFLQYLNKKHVKFSNRVFIALILGIILGLILQLIYGATSEEITNTVAWYNIIGTGYVKLLQMVAMPLVFISILSAFTKLKLGNNLGKIAGLILLILVGTTAISAGVGITSASIFNLNASELVQGEAEKERGASLEEKSAEVTTLPEQIIELLPANPFLDLTGARSTSTIAVVIFAAFLGFSYLRVVRKDEETSKTIKKLIESIYSLVMGVVTIVLRLTPFGILAIMARTVATSDFAAIYNLGKFVLASYVALIVVFFIHLLIISLSGLSPIMYIKKSAETLLFAFTSRSSAGTLPLNLKTQIDRFGVPDGIANFAGSFGLSIGQNGCAGVYPAMLAVMIAPTVGINPLNPSFILTVIFVVAISSFGVAGVGGGATFAAIIVLSALDLPIALAGVLISVEPLIDMGRTALNVSGSMVAGITTSRVTGELNKETYQNPVLKELGEA